MAEEKGKQNDRPQPRRVNEGHLTGEERRIINPPQRPTPPPKDKK